MIKAIDMEHLKITELLHCLYLIIFYLNSILLGHFLMIYLFKPTAIMIITFIVSFQGQYWTGTLYQVAFVLVPIFHYLKITVSLLLEILLIAVIYLSFLFLFILFICTIYYIFIFYIYWSRNNFIIGNCNNFILLYVICKCVFFFFFFKILLLYF